MKVSNILVNNVTTKQHLKVAYYNTKGIHTKV